MAVSHDGVVGVAGIPKTGAFVLRDGVVGVVVALSSLDCKLLTQASCS